MFSLQPVETCNVDEIEATQAVQEPSAVEDVRGMHIYWEEGSVYRWIVGPCLDRLEAAVPGLGATVLRVLEDKSAIAYPLLTPSVLLEQASHLYWLGEPDETEYLDEFCNGDPDTREAMRADMVTRAEIEASFPPWALTRAIGLSQRRLHALSTSHDDAFVRRTAELAFALARIPLSRDFMARREGLFMGFGAVLCWADDDIAVRVSNDYAQYAWQGDSFGEIGEVVLPADQPSALRRWMRTMTPQLRAIGLIDRLLHLLSA
jgi:PRTRC genetic system protein F